MNPFFTVEMKNPEASGLMLPVNLGRGEAR